MTSTTAPIPARDERTIGSVRVVLRDIARGGLAGLVVGIVVGGIGGRIVMRLAAIAVPAADGLVTENGNRIGDVTLAGTLALITFGGLFVGAMAGTIWVVIAPWLSGTRIVRAALAVPVALALTGFVLIDGSNPDFLILRRDVRVVALLLVLVALAGLSIALVDGWLDDHLPPPGASARADSIYAVLTLFGGLLILPAVAQTYLAERTPIGLALVVVGIATLAWWRERYLGRGRVPAALALAGRAGLLTAVVLGLLELAPQVARVIRA